MIRPRAPRLAAILAALVVAGIATLLAAAWWASPNPRDLDQRVAARAHEHHAIRVPLSAVSPALRQAVIATEDERFFRHPGVDVIGVFRAIPTDVRHLSLREGASTISEQVAKLLYLGGSDHTFWRKLQATVIAVRLEDRYSKDEILAAYLNSVYLGHGAYGVEAASRRYFGVHADRLTVAQASLLAGLIQAPSAFDPLVFSPAARRRQVHVLRAMVRNGYLTRERARAALGRPLSLTRGVVLPATRAPVEATRAVRGFLLLLGLAIVCAVAVLVMLRRRVQMPYARALASAGVLAALLLTAEGLRLL